MMQTMLQASVLIVLTLVLRLLLRGRLSQRIMYWLWMPVLLRLTLPGAWLRMPSRLSVMNPVQKAAEAAPQNLQPLLQNISDGIVYISGEPDAPLIVRSAAIDWQLVGLTVWAVGFVLLLVWVVVVNRRFARKLEQERLPLRSGQDLPVYAVCGLGSPCLAPVKGQYGIYLPLETTDDPEQLRHILAHETAHFRKYDHVFAVYRLGLTLFYWWNPLVWLAAAVSRQDCELACDEAALEALGEGERLRYGRTLIGLAGRRMSAKDFVCTATTMSLGGLALRERVERIVNRPKKSRFAVLFAAAAVVLGIAAAFTSAEAAPSLFGGSLTQGYPWGDPFENATIYTSFDKVAKTNLLHQLLVPGSLTEPEEVASAAFSAYSNNLQSYWSMRGIPLEEVVLFGINLYEPEDIDFLSFSVVYGVKREESQDLSNGSLGEFLLLYTPGYGALEGYDMTTEIIELSRDTGGNWVSDGSSGTPHKLAGMHLNLGPQATIEDLCSLADQNGEKITFKDMLKFKSSGAGSYYFQDYELADGVNLLHIGRRNDTDPPMYMQLVNSVTGESTDIRYGRAAIEAVADSHHSSADTVEFWTIKEFQEWMESERARVRQLAELSDKSFYEKDENGVYVAREWTKEDVIALEQQWESQLLLMQRGYRFTKPTDDGLMGTFLPAEENSPETTSLLENENIDYVQYRPGSEDALSDDVKEAILVVQEYIAAHDFMQDAELHYDRERDIKMRASYFSDETWKARGYSADRAIVLFCDFTAGDGSVLERGERYVDYMFILAKTSDEIPWEIIDQGY